MQKGLGPKILQLFNEGKSYNEIVNILKCSKGTVCYHLGNGQKAKTLKRNSKTRKRNPLQHKIHDFNERIPTILTRQFKIRTIERIIYKRIMSMKRKKNMIIKVTLDEVLNKIGNNPTCYLTGEPIDLLQPKTYALDHIIPVSQNGPNTIENLGICTKQANACKSNLNHEQFIEFCKKILEHHGYTVNQA